MDLALFGFELFVLALFALSDLLFPDLLFAALLLLPLLPDFETTFDDLDLADFESKTGTSPHSSGGSAAPPPSPHLSIRASSRGTTMTSPLRERMLEMAKNKARAKIMVCHRGRLPNPFLIVVLLMSSVRAL
jgi:hypothetical protein